MDESGFVNFSIIIYYRTYHFIDHIRHCSIQLTAILVSSNVYEIFLRFKLKRLGLYRLF